MSDPNLLRTVYLRPYLKGHGPTFTLRLWDTTRTINGGKSRLRYELRMHTGRHTIVLFAGDDFGASPLHAIDSDRTVAAILGFLTLRPGDTDREYFEYYTAEQLDYCAQHAETLNGEVYSRFGED